MTPDVIIGLVVTGLVGFTVGYLMLNKQRPIFRMYLAMLAIGMGYLYFTGAMEEIGSKFARFTPNHAPAAAPAAETKTAPAAAADQPTKTEAAPAAETKTAPDAAAPAATETKPAPATQVDPYPGAPKPAQ